MSEIAARPQLTLGYVEQATVDRYPDGDVLREWSSAAVQIVEQISASLNARHVPYAVPELEPIVGTMQRITKQLHDQADHIRWMVRGYTDLPADVQKSLRHDLTDVDVRPSDDRELAARAAAQVCTTQLDEMLVDACADLEVAADTINKAWALIARLYHHEPQAQARGITGEDTAQ